MGGYLGMEVIRQAPQRVCALAPLDTTARPDTREATENRKKLIALATGSGSFDDIHDLMWPRFVGERHQDDRSLSETVLAMLRATGPERYIHR